MKLIKRDGSEEQFDRAKIRAAIAKADAAAREEGLADVLDATEIAKLADEADARCRALGRAVSVEEVQDFVEDALIDGEHPKLMQLYKNYRTKHELMRKENSTDGRILSLLERQNEEALQENSNKNPIVNSTLRDYMAGEVSRDLCRRYFFAQDIIEAHDEGIIHLHDTDYISEPEHNCSLVNLEDMLQNGTVINGTMIEKPHSFATACNIATQIAAVVASSQYGGQTITLSHLAPFVDVSRKKIRAEVIADVCEDCGCKLSEDEIDHLVEKRVRREVARGVQTIQYQVNTILTSNGQTPFITVFMYLDEVPEGRTRDDLAMIIEEVLKQRIEGVRNEAGQWIAPAFPKLIYVLDKDNIEPGTPYYHLTELAAECTAKRMVPDYISAKVMKDLKGDVYPCMGCRSFLSVDERGMGTDGSHKYYGRFNQGVVTINLVDAALSSGGDEERFWAIMDARTELCHRALQSRHERLLGTPSDVAPILWQYGALARLEKGETINRLLYDNYSTISLGYAGLCECVRAIKGVSHTDEAAGKPFAIKVMEFLNAKCKQWRDAEGISYSLYGTPIETTTYKFAQCLQRRFGIIEGITDKNYVTNSYHVHVTEQISAFDKLAFEAGLQALSPGGAISYVEVPAMTGNIPAVLTVMRFMYDHIMYSEMNTKLDWCQACGYEGEIEIIDEDGKLRWRCPNCSNMDQKKMNVVRRTCGYLGTNYWSQGRTQEIKERVVHLSIPQIDLRDGGREAGGVP